MKKLLLMRHAKSKEAKGPDQARPLAKRGEKDAHKMAELLEEKSLLPDYLLISSARRTRETAGAVLARMEGELVLKSSQCLYMAEAPEILDAAQQVDDGAACLMIIGHNPGLESFLQYLTGAVDSLPTASVACLELPIDHWQDLTLETAPTRYDIWKPKK